MYCNTVSSCLAVDDVNHFQVCCSGFDQIELRPLVGVRNLVGKAMERSCHGSKLERVPILGPPHR